jgi:hypothetical protein
MFRKGYALLLMLLIVIVIGVVVWLLQMKGPETEPRGSADTAAAEKSDEEAYRRTMGKYGFHGGGEEQ